MPRNTYLPVSAIASEATDDLVRLLVVQGHVRTLLGVAVGDSALLLADAKMRDVGAVLVDDFLLGVVESKLAVLDAILPATAHGLVVVLDAKGLAFGDADLVGLASAGPDGVVDARQADTLDGGNPIVRGHCIGLAFALVGVGTKAAAGSRSFLSADDIGRCNDAAQCRRQESRERERELHVDDVK